MRPAKNPPLIFVLISFEEFPNITDRKSQKTSLHRTVVLRSSPPFHYPLFVFTRKKQRAIYMEFLFNKGVFVKQKTNNLL